jgi:predicted O-methyltransferase YrrM
MDDHDVLLSLLNERPKFHGSPERPQQWGIGRELAEFIFRNVGQGQASLETGCGISTLIFAIKKSVHTTVTPCKSEIEAISSYAKNHSISLDTIRFANEESEKFLPKAIDAGPLDLVLIDGRHAFPWPAIDYFYTASRVKRGGIIVVDDIMIPSVRILADFMSRDDNWRMTKEVPRRALAFVKIGNELDVEWVFQAYNRDYWRKLQNRSTLRKAARKTRRAVKEFLNKEK